MSPRPIRFVHRGQVVEAEVADPTRTVLEWLREDRRCTGTKEGCAEGDCGACTVVLGRLDRAGALRLHPVNACIQLLPMIDGAALYTVEDVGGHGGAPLHPVQQALVDCHGSQCGFCTPGFVMSLWATHRRHVDAGTVPDRRQLADDLAGNLCRCTGYRPILDAGERMFTLPAPPFDRAPVERLLQSLREAPALDLGSRWAAPRTLDDFAALRLERPDARIVAGCTDVGLWVTKQLRALPALLSIAGVAELQAVVARDDGGLEIGAAASLEDAWGALVQRWPALRDLWLRFASPPVRHAGTMGGNVANGSPIGDSAPVLMALGADLVLRRGARVRTLPLDGFYTGYQRNRLDPGEFVQALQVPPPRADTVVRAYKVSKRYDSDISAVCAAFALTRDAGGTVTAARFAFGGMAATVQRAAAAEAAAVGRPWDEATVTAAMAALGGDFTPLSDLRASAGYRLQVARNLLRRCWLETRADDPLPEAAVTVWAREALA